MNKVKCPASRADLTSVPSAVLVAVFTAGLIAVLASPARPADADREREKGAPAAGTAPIEQTEVPGGLVREKLRLPGFDPDEAVPAIAFRPSSGGPFPVAFALHYFRGSKETMEGWCRDLAARGIFAIAIDAHLHGERSVGGIFHGDNIAALGEEYSIWVHQTSIARTARDVPVILDALARRSDIDASRVAATGFSMGASTAMVLACRESRVQVVASVAGAVDFWWDVTKIPPGPEQEARTASYCPRLRELVDSIDPKARLGRIPPKALFIASGGRDGYIDIESVRRFVAGLEPLYGADRSRLRFLPVPEAGHEATEEMWRHARDWIVRGLQAKPAAARPGGAPTAPAAKGAQPSTPSTTPPETPPATPSGSPVTAPQDVPPASGATTIDWYSQIHRVGARGPHFEPRVVGYLQGQTSPGGMAQFLPHRLRHNDDAV
jgi:hypothetical protein